MPRVGAGYNLARWLTRNDHDAQDVVQEAYLRALKFFGGFHGSDGRAWLLAIVRNACHTWLHQKRARSTAGGDEGVHGGETEEPAAAKAPTPQARRQGRRPTREDTASGVYFPAPPELRGRIETAIRRDRETPRAPRSFPWRGLALAASLAFVMLAGWDVIRSFAPPSAENRLTEEVFASNVRSQMLDR